MRVVQRIEGVLTITLFLCCSSVAVGQIITNCDSIIATPDTLAKLNGGYKALGDLVVSKIVPTIQDCSPLDKRQFSSLRTLLTIDKLGRVIDVEFKKTILT